MSTTGTLEASLSEDLQRKKQRWWRNCGGGNLFGNIAVRHLGVEFVYFKLLSYDSSVYLLGQLVTEGPEVSTSQNAKRISDD